MTDDADNLRLLALAATGRPMVAPSLGYADGAALLRLLDRVEAAEQERDALLNELNGLVAASGSPTHGGAAGHVRALLAERDELRALLKRVLSCGLNEEPHGVGFAPSKQEKRAGELARDIAVALRKGE